MCIRDRFFTKVFLTSSVTASGWKGYHPKNNTQEGLFPIEKLLLPVDNSTYKEAKIEEYYNASTWEGYQEAVSKLKYERPKTPILKPPTHTRELERLGEYYDESR